MKKIFVFLLQANLCEDYDESDKPIIDIKDLIKLAQIVANR